mgnify:CR=1 FL=1
MSSSVEQIKSRLNIVDVVQSYVKLQKAGVNFKANCPFHLEKTPSFFVSPSRESWHCFGCSRGGDIFSFVTEIEGVDFPEALKILADKAGVELKSLDPRYKNERMRLLGLLDEAKKFYEAELRKNDDVIDYLKKRGLTGETAKDFGIGFAPDGWRNLHDFLGKKGYSQTEMEKAGMIVKSSNYYDRFRNRIMFPINNSAGQVVGFSGRIFVPQGDTFGNPKETPLGKTAPAKYINTPQTILYDKSKILYCFDKAKNEIRRKDFCIVVEGQMDAIMSHQAGVANTVAVSGTALSKDHLNLIKRLTQNIVIAFDKDEAGLGAASRGIDLALTDGFEVKIAVIEFGKDPADVVKENPEEWIKTVGGAKNILEFYLGLFNSRKDIEKKVLPYVALLSSEMEQSHWVREIADRLRIREESVWREMEKIKPALSTLKPDFQQESSPNRRTRLELLRDRLVGFVFWRKNTDDAELKDIINKIIGKKGINLDQYVKEDQSAKLAFEAELFYSETQSLKEEIDKIMREFEREETKSELEEITEKIRNLESDKSGSITREKEEKLKKYLNDFHVLTKKLNE